ncbi:hypothetical protein COU19_03370 [Candidatus Kaiserbacteria bacterium CG10_big_fil_rev_8_21_14_0_10_56_12]|uniref:Uncharacterized protein n=1 Tax=Candidatus Kaiserbacteria bacterium CG10_big_fil_rev_8_21_14_0_10_56_12 TaxID=1974611 RepID=A0A2H0U952_9BACT|nr:MAG: hypothetical protein COU19_03370 [Candidatus Kaiserbacteria bacterium CG10_big_fil_rev_8_21_14_0_10_56_12]
MRARVRQTKSLEKFPSDNPWRRALDYLMYAVGLLAPLALVPQILQLYGSQSSAGLSFATWGLLTIVTALWTVYGAAHRDKQIFFANLLLTIFNGIVAVGILLYS